MPCSRGCAYQITVAAHLFWLEINLIDCHRINRYNDISIKKEKVPEHLFLTEKDVLEPLSTMVIRSKYEAEYNEEEDIFNNQ